jgi:hypothetical protein
MDDKALTQESKPSEKPKSQIVYPDAAAFAINAPSPLLKPGAITAYPGAASWSIVTKS